MYRTSAAAPTAQNEPIPSLEPALRPRARAWPPLYYALLPAAYVFSFAVYSLLGWEPSIALLAAFPVAPMLVILFDRGVLVRRITSRFNTDLAPALEALGRGRLDEAEATFRRLFERSLGRGGLQAISLFNVAAVRARRGDAAGAVSILLVLDEFAPTARAANVKVLIAPTLALHYAQLADVNEARRWLGISLDRKRAGSLLYTANVEALILTREGKYAEAEAAYLREWPDLERVLSAVSIRAVRVRRAFNLERSGADPAEVKKLIDASRPADRDELVHIGAGWPEMRGFLERNELV